MLINNSAIQQVANLHYLGERALECSADIPVRGFTGLPSPVSSGFETGDWKVAATRRLEILHYRS